MSQSKLSRRLTLVGGTAAAACAAMPASASAHSEILALGDRLRAEIRDDERVHAVVHPLWLKVREIEDRLGGGIEAWHAAIQTATGREYEGACDIHDEVNGRAWDTSEKIIQSVPRSMAELGVFAMAAVFRADEGDCMPELSILALAIATLARLKLPDGLRAKVEDESLRAFRT